MNRTEMKTKRLGRYRSDAVNVVILSILVLGSLVIMLPFVWMFSTSWRLPIESFNLPPQWIPTTFRISNYQRVFKVIPFVVNVLNSLKVGTLITLGQLLTCSMAAFAFAKLRFPGRNFLFILLLSSLMIPIQVVIIPTFILMRILRLLNTHTSLIIPSLMSAFGIFLLRQFFLTIPDELIDSAKIDGAGYFTIFWRIMLPLTKPALSVLALFTFNFYWNEFFRPLIFLKSYNKMTIPLALVQLSGYYQTGSVSITMAGVSLAIIPVLVIFLLTQRYLIEGITLTGLKG